MRSSVTRWLGLLLLLGVLPLIHACTVDDSIIEGKKCDPVTRGPCISGYSCDCDHPPGDCRCRKGLQPVPTPGTFSLTEQNDDPSEASLRASVRLLRRHGALVQPASPSR